MLVCWFCYLLFFGGGGGLIERVLKYMDGVVRDLFIHPFDFGLIDCLAGCYSYLVQLVVIFVLRVSYYY